jgi:hypothetical protein
MMNERQKQGQEYRICLIIRDSKIKKNYRKGTEIVPGARRADAFHLFTKVFGTNEKNIISVLSVPL